MDILGGLAVFFAILSLVSSHSAEIQKDSREGSRQKLGTMDDYYYCHNKYLAVNIFHAVDLYLTKISH